MTIISVFNFYRFPSVSCEVSWWTSFENCHVTIRLENLDSNFTLLKDAYEESKKLFEIKIPSWYGSITLLIKNIRGLKELSNVSKHKFKSSYKDVIYQVYKENWGKQMLKHSEGKLCSYSKFKTYFMYIEIL